MKPNELICRLGAAGRVVLPLELRTALDLQKGTPMEIYTDGRCIVLKKYCPVCIYCNHAEGTILFKGKYICASCLAQLKQVPLE